MNFEHPLFLLLLIPVLAGVVFQYWRLLPGQSKIQPLLLSGSVLCLVIALANPSWKTVPGKTLSKDANFIIILDVSQSMFCKEEGLSRMEQAQSLIKGFLPELRGSSIAIVYFAGDAQIGSPFTEDEGAVRLFLDSVVPKMSATPGTKAQPLQELLAQMLKEDSALAESNRKQIGLLFSDGEFSDKIRPLKQWLEGNPKFTLFSFACGRGKSPVPRYDLSSVYPGAFSAPRATELSELAEAGRGKLFRLSDPGGAGAALASLSSGVRQIISEGERVPLYEDYPFLLAGLVLLLAYQSYPFWSAAQESSAFRIAAMIAGVCFFTLAMTSGEKRAVFNDALQAIRQKQYQKAIAELHQLKQEGAGADADIALGNAYFYQDRYDDAIAHYRQALEQNPDSETARWNWEVALKRKSQSGPPPPNAPPPPQASPPDTPRESQALLKYSDQREREQMKELNSQNAKSNTFAW